MYTVNSPVKRPVWKDHEIVGYVIISRTDADFLNSFHPNGFYLGFTDEEHRLLNSGTEDELREAGFTN